MKKLTIALALGVLVLPSTNSFAWFEICNTKSKSLSEKFVKSDKAF